jgi:hypothetical protein
MFRTRNAPSLPVLALAGVILFIAILLVLVALLAGSGNGTGHSQVRCTTAPTLAPAGTHPCAAHTTGSVPGRESTTGTRQPAGPARKELARKGAASKPKAPAAPKAPVAPKPRR